MADDKALAKQEVTGPPSTGYGQVVPLAHQVLPHRELVSRVLRGIWKLDQHFYVIAEYDKETRQKVLVHRPILEGKMYAGALAGCWHETSVVDRKVDYVRAEASVFYRTPTGQLVRFKREKEVSIPLERQAAIQRKINSILYYMKGKDGNAKRYQEINEKYASFQSEADAHAYLCSTLLDVLDLQEINDNMIKLRQTLANMACSKALSSAYTEFLRYVGQRIVFKALKQGEIEVTLINTIEIPKQGAREAVRMLYEDTLETEERDAAQALESESAVHEEPEKSAEAPLVDTSTGEVLEGSPAAEPEASPSLEPQGEEGAETPSPMEGEGRPLREMLKDQIVADAATLGWTQHFLAVYMKTKFGRVKASELTDNELGDLATCIRDERQKAGK